MDIIKDNLVYMKNIRVEFGKVIALDGVDFSVGRNEVVGLLGDNGAGKSTLIKALIGFHRISAGEMFFDRRQVNFKSTLEARLSGIETVYQDLALVDLLSISRNFFLARELKKRIGLFSFFDHKLMEKITRKALKEFGFEGKREVHKSMNYLSGGERQAVAISRANHFATKLLILDEPTAALSPSETELVLRLVLKAKQKGLSVIFVTHSSHEVFEVADRFVVLQNGKNYADLRKKDITIKDLEKLIISSRLAAVSEMAAKIAHQIRNPLGVMKVSAEMLRDDFQVTESRESFEQIVDLLINKIDTLNNVVTNFIDFARFTNINKTPYSVKGVISAALECLPLNDFPQVKISVHVRDRLPRYPMDKSLMQQVLSNLILNALQASLPRGRVAIRAFMEKQLLTIEIEDWGCGLDEKTEKQMFHPFFSTKTNGTGLGLCIVHRIVDQHKGTIQVHSIPGKGTTFRIVF